MADLSRGPKNQTKTKSQEAVMNTNINSPSWLPEDRRRAGSLWGDAASFYPTFVRLLVHVYGGAAGPWRRFTLTGFTESGNIRINHTSSHRSKDVQRNQITEKGNCFHPLKVLNERSACLKLQEAALVEACCCRYRWHNLIFCCEEQIKRSHNKVIYQECTRACIWFRRSAFISLQRKFTQVQLFRLNFAFFTCLL